MTTRGDQEALTTEQQLAILQQKLIRAQRLTALGELVSTTTHEFNNVLMTILNYAKMGLRHKDEATRDKAFQKVLAAAERAAKITNSVLGMARNRSDSFEPTDLAKLIEESLVLLERELRNHRISVETHLASVPNACAVGNQIQQVILNLLINARQAMPDGGRLLIRLEQSADGATVDLTIRDTGCGIAADKAVPHLRPLFQYEAGAGLQRQRRHGPGAERVPAHHRIAPRPHPCREHRRRGDGVYDPIARVPGAAYQLCTRRNRQPGDVGDSIVTCSDQGI
jgi:signal transduction histidine kinase